MIGRQFLLCSINIKDKNIWSELINNSESIEEKDLAASDWTLKKDYNFNYCANSPPSEFNYRQALEKARNHDLLWSRKVENSSKMDIRFDKFKITQRDTSLIVDYHGNFLLIIGYTLSFQTNDVECVIKEVLKNRAVINNLNDGVWFSDFQDQVKDEVLKYVASITKQNNLAADIVELNPDAAFPLFFSDSPSSENLLDLFKNEESLEQRQRKSAISSDYEESFFHVGWNYTLALKFPEDVNEHIFSILAKMQMSYYKFRYYKEYFNDVFSDILKNSEKIDSEKVDFFDKLKLKYNSFLANYFKFKYGLYPKFNEVMDSVEKLWNIDNDTTLLEKTFNAQTEFVNKKYSEINQRLNDKQNQALNIIALLQIVAFISVIYDSFGFQEQWPTGFYTTVVLLVVSVTAALSLYLSVSMVRKKKKLKKR